MKLSIFFTRTAFSFDFVDIGRNYDRRGKGHNHRKPSSAIASTPAVASMSRLVLYRAIASPPARAVMMLADILDLKMDIRDVNIVKMEHKAPEFIKLNPMGTVPVLQDDDFVVSESNAIMKYILEKYGGEHRERLYPSDLQTRATVDQCMFFNAGVFFTVLRNVGMRTLMGNLQGPTDQDKANLESSYGIIEAYLSTRPYIAADRLTLADLATGATATAVQCMHNVDGYKFPRCADWLSRLEEETFFKTVNKEGAVYFGKLLNSFWKKNKLNNKL